MLWCDYNEFYVMNRIKCIVSYDGSKFHGFQVQNQFRTVQGEIQKAIKNICKDENIVIHASVEQTLKFMVEDKSFTLIL